MLIGSACSILFGIILVSGFSYFFGYKNEYFTFSCILYSIGSVLSCHWNTLLVDSILDFNYKIVTVSEAVSFTISTLLQYLLVVQMGYHPLLSYGIASLISEIFKIVICLVMKSKEYPDQKAVFGLQFQSVKINGHERYLTDEQIQLSKQLAGMNFFQMFMTEAFNLYILKDSIWAGAITLLKSFQNLAVRFIFCPTDVSLN